MGLKHITKIQKRKVHTNVKVILFFYSEGLIRHEFLHRGQLVTKKCHLKVMQGLRGSERKIPDLWKGKNGCSIMTL